MAYFVVYFQESELEEEEVMSMIFREENKGEMKKLSTMSDFYRQLGKYSIYALRIYVSFLMFSSHQLG